MAVDQLAALAREVEPIREEAERWQNRYQRESTEIQRDPRLSDQGKQEQINELREATKSNMKTLRAREESAIKSRITSIERQLFGLPSSSNDPNAMISFRDAQDRAERLDDADAAKTLLARAERTSDRNLADAIIRIAAERGWRSVAAEYEAHHPGTGKTLSDLIRIRELQTDGSFQRTMAYAFL